MVVLGRLPFFYISCMISPYQCPPINPLSIGQAEHHTFSPSLNITQNILRSSCLGNWWRQKVWDLVSMNLSSNVQQGKNKMEIQKHEYLNNEKRFLDEIKRIFHYFLRTIILWKIKTIADTSFRYIYFLFKQVYPILYYTILYYIFLSSSLIWWSFINT